ncbi:MAG: IS30 family transposase, partial [Gammaproteobacteria bacterium]|nr:IS30 family transposase [Gammaproteobacteria bacterium]
KKYVLSFTFDNGGEFAQHQMIAKKLHAEVYFCDPYASYQKGSVEQGNGVIRSELPRKIDFESMTQNEINQLMRGINRHSMELHNGESPAEYFRKTCGGKLSGIVALQT